MRKQGEGKGERSWRMSGIGAFKFYDPNYLEKQNRNY
jgi:hypothetical protein